LGVVDIVIKAILRHSDVAATRESYIKRDGIDPELGRNAVPGNPFMQPLCNVAW
jgi:hypothetical protein